MSIMELKPETHLKLEVAERPGSLHQKDVTLVYFYSHTLLIRAPFICLTHNPNTLPDHLFHHFLFTIIAIYNYCMFHNPNTL